MDDEAAVRIDGAAELFAPSVASTPASEIRLTLSPDGATALWFSRDRRGGPGGYDIWMSRRRDGHWGAVTPVSFNSPQRDFDPAFSADGRYVYFCSDRPGGLGGDDVYRVPVTGEGFGTVEALGAAINSASDEFAPMLAPDGDRLLFSSDRAGGAGGHDLYLAQMPAGKPQAARPIAGAINTTAHEFDATFLSDGTTIVFARAQDFDKARVDLFAAAPRAGRYDTGMRLPPPANHDGGDSYGPMLDWSQPDRFTLSARRPGSGGMDLYQVRYRLPAGSDR